MSPWARAPRARGVNYCCRMRKREKNRGIPVGEDRGTAVNVIVKVGCYKLLQ